MHELLREIAHSGPTTPIYWTVLATLLALGGVVGSFLNVLVYRWPAGQSILRPGSRCPRCATPIRARDNIPVLGWLMLRGRCRDCQQPISPRYPLVELAAALLFAGLAVVGPLCPPEEDPLAVMPPPEAFAEPSGETEPGEFAGPIAGPGGGLMVPQRVRDVPKVRVRRLDTTERWGLYALHLVLVCGLIVASGIERDGHRLPWRVALGVLLIGLAATAAWPQWQVPCPNEQTLPVQTVLTLNFGGQRWMAWGANLAAGALLGVGLGCFAGLATGEGPSGKAGRWTTVVALVWIGVVLDWHAVAAIALAACAAWVPVRLLAHFVRPLRSFPFSLWLLCGAVAWIADETKPWLARWSTLSWPIADRDVNIEQMSLVASSVGVMLLAALGGVLGSRPVAQPAAGPTVDADVELVDEPAAEPDPPRTENADG